MPVAILGSHKVRNWKRLQFPKVLIQFGEPFRLEQVAEPTREQQQEAADFILERIRSLHTGLAERGYRAIAREHRENSSR